jgi:GntR family transcriptional regulator
VVRVPKYYRVKNQILELIAGLDPGTPVPTERDLAERFATSRTTLRQAIAELVVDGRLEHTQGRGTFVAQPKLMQVRQLTSFSQDLQEEGWRPGSVVLKITEEPADAEVATNLQVAPGTPIHRVERLRTAGDEPIAHEIAHLPGPLPDLAAQLERAGSLYRTLREAFGIDLEGVEDVVETALADPVEAALLGVDTGLPMLLVHRTGWDADGRVVEWTRSVFRGDRFRFVARRRLADDLPAAVV